MLKIFKDTIIPAPSSNTIQNNNKNKENFSVIASEKLTR